MAVSYEKTEFETLAAAANGEIASVKIDEQFVVVRFHKSVSKALFKKIAGIGREGDARFHQEYGRSVLHVPHAGAYSAQGRIDLHVRTNALYEVLQQLARGKTRGYATPAAARRASASRTKRPSTSMTRADQIEAAKFNGTTDRRIADEFDIPEFRDGRWYDAEV